MCLLGEARICANACRKDPHKRAPPMISSAKSQIFRKLRTPSKEAIVPTRDWSSAGLGACPSNRRVRAHGACEASSRREEEAMSMHIFDDEQRRDRPQSPCAQRVSSGAGHLRRWRSSTMYTDIACIAPPCICPAALETRPLLLLGPAPRTPQSYSTVRRGARESATQ